jgi:Magnesium chelatase, subunit ChlI
MRPWKKRGEWEHAQRCGDTPRWGKRHARRRQPVGPQGDGHARGTFTANRLLLKPHGFWLPLGPPGACKSLLARRLTTILPAMTLAEAVETTRIQRVAGLTGDRTAWVATRAYRAPLHDRRHETDWPEPRATARRSVTGVPPDALAGWAEAMFTAATAVPRSSPTSGPRGGSAHSLKRAC